MKSTTFLAMAFLLLSLTIAADANAMCGLMGSDRDVMREDMLYGTEFQSKGDYDAGDLNSTDSTLRDTDESEATVSPGTPFDQGEMLNEGSKPDIVKVLDDEGIIEEDNEFDIDVPEMDLPDVDIELIDEEIDIDVPDLDVPDIDVPDLDVDREIDLI